MEDGIMDDGGLEGCIEEMGKLVKDKSSYLGMEFPSEEAAYEFYNEFGSIRKDYCNKSKKDGVMTNRWRLDAKDCEVEEENVIMDEDDPKLLILARYRDLCPRMVKLATQASMHKLAYQLIDEGIKELCVKVNNMMK
ncbi:hypothetical protein ACSBR1_004179 [Camellia fascicularis]